MRRQLDFSVEENHLKHFRSNFGLPSPPFPDDLLPLHNKYRSKTETKQTVISPGEQREKRQHANLLKSLPMKILGMRRQVTFPYAFEGLSSGEVLVMTLEGGFTLNKLFKLQRIMQQRKESAFGKRASRWIPDLSNVAGFGQLQRDDDAAMLPGSAAATMIAV